MTPANVLSVRLYGQPVGSLEQTLSGKMRFAYLPSAPCPLSIGMPIRPEPYDEIRTEAYFGGLLPESEQARNAIGKRYGVNPHNSFSLLKAIGYDCAGAVSLHPTEELPHSEALASSLLTAKALSEQELHRHIQDLPQKPLFLGVAGLRLSLAGAQDKAAVCLVEDEIALPQDGCPTTHILKPVIPGYEGIVHNEYLCLKIAARVGLKVPPVEIRWAQDIPYLLTARYDREVEDNRVRRIHQEDFCQALGIVSARKYQHDGGPDFNACFELLRHTTQPVKDRNAMAALMIFNYLIGNLDAHGKNFSLLHRAAHRVEMAPAYDLVCTRVYEALAQKMAMKIGGYYEPDKIFPRHWERQCKEIGYSYPIFRDMLHHQAKAILEACEQERTRMHASGVSHPILDQIARFLEKQIPQTLQRFEV